MSVLLPTSMPAPAPAPGGLATFFHISRFHIILIAACASLTFSWVFSGQHLYGIPLIVAVDWFLVNLLNRVVDLAEDQTNGVVGTSFVAQHARGLTWLCLGVMFLSFPVVQAFYPMLMETRLLFHLIGLGYNYRFIPSFKGLTRFKELYFFKNFASGVLFILSGIVYPVMAAGVWEQVPSGKLWLLMGFFLAMDLTYEILYDLRDLPGDRAEGVPTFPVVHGEKVARAIVVALLGLAAALLLGGYAAHSLAFQEVIMVAAVIQQGLFVALKVPKGLKQTDCVFITYLGAAQLLSYNVWIWLGLPLSLG
ncbi:MAG: UbiA family prenyltransferase [Myxococcota bacterium]